MLVLITSPRKLSASDDASAFVMNHPPLMRVAVINHLQQSLRFIDSDSQQLQEMPENQKVVHEMFVGAANLPADQIHFDNAGIITQLFETFVFDVTDEGKTAYHRCCYENLRGERGPWSEPLQILVA